MLFKERKGFFLKLQLCFALQLSQYLLKMLDTNLHACVCPSLFKRPPLSLFAKTTCFYNQILPHVIYFNLQFSNWI